jgi:hypothetical protein
MALAGPSSPPQPATNTYNYASASGYTSDEYAGGADSDPDPAPEWEALRARLLPLRHLEALLITRLVPLHEDEPTHLDFGGGAAARRGGNEGEGRCGWGRDRGCEYAFQVLGQALTC